MLALMIKKETDIAQTFPGRSWKSVRELEPRRYGRGRGGASFWETARPYFLHADHCG